MRNDGCVFEYCNFEKSYLKVSLLSRGGKVEKEMEIALGEYADKNGALTSPAAVADRIAYELNLKRVPDIRLVLRCKECFKSMFSLPKMPEFRANALLRKELKERSRPEYVAFTDMYRYDEGYLYSTYYMPLDIIDFFKKVAKHLGARMDNPTPYGFYLLETLNYEGSYVYFYIRKKICTMLSVADGKLVSTYDFEYETEKDIRNRFLLVMSKYEFDFGKKPITRYAIDSDAPLEIGSNLGLIRITDSPEPPKKEEPAETQTLTDEIEVEWDEFAGDTSTFEERYAKASEKTRQRFQALRQQLLKAGQMQSGALPQAAVFYVKREIYAQIDIRDEVICLYLALDSEKYKNTRYPCALSMRGGFDATPCLYRISSASQLESAELLIQDLAREHGLVRQTKE